MSSREPLAGERFELELGSEAYPPLLAQIDHPPKRLYGIGSQDALRPGVAVIGSRKATPYGLRCAHLFASRAAERGAVIISGGARGCDQQAHRAAVELSGPTVVCFAGGADVVYPAKGRKLFEQVLSCGGAIVSEHPWGTQPLRPFFVQRNRIIAGLAKLLLIAEAGLPSGTFTTADAALSNGRDVVVVPGAITSANSRGSNSLFFQGARPVVDVKTFDAELDAAFADIPLALMPLSSREEETACFTDDPVLKALSAEAYNPSELAAYFSFSLSELVERLGQYEMAGLVQRRGDGRYQVVPK